MRRVKYFSNHDGSIGSYLSRVKEILELDLSTVKVDMNFALETVNVIKFINNGLYDKSWSKPKDKLPGFHKLIDKYFSSLKEGDFPNALVELEHYYREDFIDQFEKYDLGSKIKESDFKNLLSSSNMPTWEIMKSKYIVQEYPSTIKEIFLSDPKNFETILSNFTSDKSHKVFVPKSISKEEMIKFCNEYIDSKEANANFVNILAKPIKGLEKYVKIDSVTKLKAKRRAESIENELFKERTAGGINVKMTVVKSKLAYEKELASSKPSDVVILVDKEWIKKHHDFPTVMNNIQYLYELFSADLISELPSFPRREMSVFEVHLGVKTNNSYPMGYQFIIKQRMAVMVIQVLSELLEEHGIVLEGVIDWFFSTYIKDVFGIEWTPLKMPSQTESIANQTATLLRIEESIRTQYHVFAEHGLIDPELVNMTSTPPFRDLNSLVENKYVYLSGSEDVQIMIDLLFSDQSSINYINEGLKGGNFVDLIVNNPVKLTDFSQSSAIRVQYLIDNGAVVELEGGQLKPRDILRTILLRDLYNAGVIGYNHISLEKQKKLDSMIKDGVVNIGNTLYSIQEQDHLNFMLNNSKFDNSWAIRNNYQHGVPTYDNEYHYKFDNSLVKLVLLSHVVKMNDELNLQNVSSGGESISCDIIVD